MTGAFDIPADVYEITTFLTTARAGKLPLRQLVLAGVVRANLPSRPRCPASATDASGAVPSGSRLADWERVGIRIVCPGDAEWPTQLDVLGDARPLVLWLHGSADLRFACLRSVSVVGARAATGYGQHVATEMAAALAERGWCVISGGP